MADAVQTLPNTKSDLITSMVQRELQAQSKFLPYIDNLSGFAGKGVTSISPPKLSSFTAVDRAFGAGTDAFALTDAKDTINLNKNKIIRWIEDARDNFQSTIEYRVEASKRAASGHARAVDQDICSGLIGGAFSFQNATAASALITKGDILAMRAKLLKENANLEDVTLFISVDNEASMLDIAEFIRADHYGSSSIGTGILGSIYGVKVVVSNVSTLGSKQAIMAEKSGYGIAFQQDVQMSEQGDNRYGANSKVVAIDQVFGHGVLQDGEGSANATESPLIVKLNEDND